MLDESQRIADRLRGIDDPKALLEGLLAHAPVAFQVFQASGHSLFVNRAFRELFGAEPPPEYNVLTDEVVAAQGSRDLIKRAFRGETIHVPPNWYDPRELKHVTITEGRRVALQVTLFPLFDRQGVIRHVALCFKDVTPDLELQRSEQQFRAVFESALDGILITDDANKLVDVNPAACEVFGRPREQLVGRILGDLADFGEKGPPTAEVPVGRPGSTGEFRVQTFQGETKNLEYSATFDFLPGRHLSFFRDVTEHKRTEELQRRSTELIEQNRTIQAASRMKSEFLANMSHELRTPLNAIIGFAELMHDGKVGPVSDSHRECLKDVLDSSRYLLSLINGVLDLAKVESGQLEFHAEPVDLRALLLEVTDVLRGLATQKKIRIESDVDPSLTQVLADAARLRQILYNYLSNALKFTSAEGLVKVRITPDGPAFYRIEVADTGIGIRPQDLSRLFLEFQQLDAGMAKKFQGTGLGLALTKRIVEAQGGRVDVQSQFGKGSVFFASLPRVLTTKAQSSALVPTATAVPGELLPTCGRTGEP